MFHIQPEFWISCTDCDFFEIADSAGEAEDMAKDHLTMGGLERPFLGHAVHIEAKTVVRACCDGCGVQLVDEKVEEKSAPKLALPN